MRTRSLIGVLAVFSAVACTQDADVARHTVEEYRADAELRREVFAACVSDPGTRAESADCVNAIEAERLESRGSLRDLPPVGLDPNRAR
jgi:hypothetical protein